MTVTEQILHFLTTELEQRGQPIVLTSDLALLDSGVLDSVTLMQLVAFLERSFEIELAPAQIISSNFATVNDIAALVEDSRAGAAT